jgi:hypothetical protein
MEVRYAAYRYMLTATGQLLIAVKLPVIDANAG